ncbi:MAG: NosY protein [candidate division WOR-3 bacterium]
MLIKLMKYELFDIFKSKWLIFIFLFYSFIGYIFSYFGKELTRAILSHANVSLITLSLFSILFSSTYIYNNTKFIEFIITQPVKRKTIFISIFLSITLSLTISFSIGSFLPFFYFYSFNFNYLKILFLNCFIIPLFVSLGMFLAIIERDKLKGIGFAILIWLFTCALYDSILLYITIAFSSYPIEKIIIFLTLINPLDSFRLITLMDTGLYEIMGFVGKWLLKYFSNFWIISIILSLIYTAFFTLLSIFIFERKDF